MAQAVLTKLETEVKSVIPSIRDDPDLTSNIAMAAGVSVLETLDAVRGDRDAVVRASFSPLEVLRLLQLYIGKPVHPDFELFDVIDDSSVVPVEIHKEWQTIRAMIHELSTNEALSKSFRQSQEEHGAYLLGIYTDRL